MSSRRAGWPERLTFSMALGQPEMQLPGNHFKKVEAGFAHRRRQKLAGAAVKIENLALSIDQHGRKGVFMQDGLFDDQAHAWPAGILRIAPAGRPPAARVRGIFPRRQRCSGMWKRTGWSASAASLR